MSLFRLTLGVAAATAAAVMYSNSRKRLGSSADESLTGMGSTPGTDRWTGGSSTMEAGKMGSSGASMTFTDNDDLPSPASADDDGLGGSSSAAIPPRGVGM